MRLGPIGAPACLAGPGVERCNVGLIESVAIDDEQIARERRREAQAGVVAEMKRFLPTDELSILMELSVEPVAAQLGLVAAPA